MKCPTIQYMENVTFCDFGEMPHYAIPKNTLLFNIGEMPHYAIPRKCHTVEYREKSPLCNT